MIHKHEPVSEEQMNWISPDETVCETLRHAYAEIKSVNDEAIFGDNRLDDAMLQIRTATAMAKSMTRKLQEYNRNWRKGFWDANENFTAYAGARPIDVLFIAWDDFANTGFRFWQCAKYLGLNSLMVKGKSHAFGYPAQAPVHPSLASAPICQYPLTVMAPGLESLMASARVIHLIASTYPLVAFNWANANVVVQHGGSVYRQNPQSCNDVFNHIAKKTVIQCPDLLGLGAKNESWIYYPVDTHLLKPDFSAKGEIPVVGHFPSNPKVKGTEAVEQALAELHAEGLKFTYVGSKDIVAWPENLKRVAGCDIIVEGCETKQGDKVYGEWGNAALEASALGCAVFTHCLHQEQYQSEFGEAGPCFHTDKESLKANLRQYIVSWEKIRDLKHRCRKWVEEKHSIPVTANRLWDKVYGDFFNGR